jgi:PncC family amidohydrolase
MNIENLSKRIGKILFEKRMTLAVAESCTGGMIGGAITDAPGASLYFIGGVIAYDNRIKKDILRVPQAMISNYGAVSGQTVAAMARGGRRLMKADCALAVSGVAGPDGGLKEKPVGLVYIAIAVKSAVKSFKYRFRGTRSRIRRKAVQESLQRLIQLL